MSILDFIDVIVFYGLDVVALALATSVLVQVLKKTVLKKVPNKFYTFLPFIIGTFLYAVYETIYHLDWQYCFHNYVTVLEYGAVIGSIATFAYVLYEQFFREGNGLSAVENMIAQLLEGYVCEENIENTAQLIAEILEDDSTETGIEAAAQIIKENSSQTASGEDVLLLAKLIAKTLATLSAAD